MPLVFKHEAVLTFMGRLVNDREFSEWFASRPAQALASHGLSIRDVQDVADVLSRERQQRHVAEALEPVVLTLLEVIDQGAVAEDSDAITQRFARLRTEFSDAHDRLAAARRQSRPWWKIW
jgi:hypothetical protein